MKPAREFCRSCGLWLMYSARLRGNNLCWQCTRHVARARTRRAELQFVMLVILLAATVLVTVATVMVGCAP